MKRSVLFIGKKELLAYFNANERQDIKIVTPLIMTKELAKKLIKRGKIVKEESPLKGNNWSHSLAENPNRICESNDFNDELIMPNSNGPVSISFANIGSIESFHYHKEHWEIYYSEHKISSTYRLSKNSDVLTKTLEDGGAIMFTPGVIHKIEVHGLTIVIETPAVPGDRIELKDQP